MRRIISEQRKQIKKERIQSIFVQTAKELILDIGIDEISVRKVSELSGYSYATIYNHFKDFNALLFAVKLEMIQDVMKLMSESLSKTEYTLEDIKKINRMHVKYYIDNPNVFECLYSFNISQPEGDDYLGSIETEWKSIYQGFVDRGILTEDQADIVSKTIIYSIHGILLIHFANTNIPVETLCHDLDRITDHLLN